MLWDAPPTFEFASPVGGTYPPWTDPSYWYEGLKYHFDASAEWISLKHNVQFYFQLFGGWFVLVLAAAFVLGGDARATLVAARQNLRYWAPPAIGLLIYLLANDLLVQWTRTPQPPTRYVAVFVVLFMLTTVAALRFRTIELPIVLKRVLTVALAAIAVVAVSALAKDDMQALTQPAPLVPWQLARGLEESGVSPGMRVATIGSSSDHELWARLARVQIIADIPNLTSFWSKSPEVQHIALLLLAKTGAQVVIAPWMPGDAAERGWRTASTTNYAVHGLAGIDIGDRPLGGDK